MKTISIINPKGGCGKSTLAVNLAGYLALRGDRTALVDTDPQGSSRDWLSRRAPTRRRIRLLSALPNRNAPLDYLVVDTPAALHGQRVQNIVAISDMLVVPILPSPIDMAAATTFLKSLLGVSRVRRRTVRVATVANRVRENALAAIRLEHYLEAVRLPGGPPVPMLTVLRASQNYIHAAESGLTLFEMALSRTYYDRGQWQPLVRWVLRG